MENNSNTGIWELLVTGGILALILQQIIHWILNMIERPRLHLKSFWTKKKGAKDDNGKPFNFMVIAVVFENSAPLKWFSRKAAEITNAKITILDKDGYKVVEKPQQGRWWDYETADSDPFFPKGKIIPQEVMNKFEVSAGDNKSLVIVYWLVEDVKKYYLATIHSHKSNRWLARRERFKGHPPYYVRIDITYSGIMETFRFCLIPDSKGNLSITNEKQFPFKESLSYN